MRRIARGLLLAALTFLSLEGAIRVLYTWRNELPPQADSSRRREWSWAQRHVEAGRAVFPSEHAYDPHLGWALKANLRGDLMHTNALGMRSRGEFTERRVPGVPRIVLIGDSYTMGANMGDRDAFHAVLGREFLAGWEVLNLGVSGYGLDQAVLRYEKLGARHRPDVAVLGFYLRDHFRNLDSFRAYAKPYFTLDERGELVLHRDHLVSPEELYAAYRSGRRRVGGWGYSWTWAAFRQHLRPLLFPRSVARDDPAWRLSAALLRRFRDAARAHGGVPFLLLIPTRPGRWEGMVYPDLDQLAVEHARTIALPTLSLGEAFHAQPDAERAEPLFGQAGHLSKAGNREMARRLAEAVRQTLQNEGLDPGAPASSR